MNLTRITAPATPPISLADAKVHLRVPSGDSSKDTLINALIDAVTSHYDGWTGVLGRAMVTQTWDVVLDAFPAGAIQIPLTPLQSVTSVKYLDTAGVEQTVDSNNYYVDTLSPDGWVVPDSDFSWPSTMAAVNAVAVRCVVGYGAAAAVPAAIRQAMLIRIGTLFTIAGRDGALRRETVDGVGSMDYDVTGAAAAGLDRVEEMLLGKWRKVWML